MKYTKNNINAVIVYLVGTKLEDILDLKFSLASLDKNFNNQFKYPIVLFHENLDDATIKEICGLTSSILQFEKVIFKIPDFLNKKEIPESYLGFSIGYRHMCRFFSGIFFNHPALEAYDWYWRLDTDSYLLRKIKYDVFSFMSQKHYEYGYITMPQEHPEVIKGFWEFTKKYIQENKIQPTFLEKFMDHGSWDRRHYSTNFEISNFNFWRTEPYKSYFNAIDRFGGIYNYRWGDAPIHSLAIYMFMPKYKTHKFNDVSYCHQNFINLPSTPKILKRFHEYLISRRLKPRLKNLGR
jgi:alpha 1,2-mannosyltransferase